ncbi:MAG: hypothetical protein LBD87_04880 [Prevotellaceae bacterium]|nr:hypothetical protein [Prevotellaceae bacterium]
MVRHSERSEAQTRNLLLCTAPAFRAEQCRRIAEHFCSARMQEASSCIPALRSASLHLHGVINIPPLTGLARQPAFNFQL